MANLGLIAPTGPAPAAPSVWVRIAALRQKDPCCLAPQFRAALEEGVRRANADGCDLVIFETCRVDALQRIYYEQGTSHAATADFSWHKHGLGTDLTHRLHDWDLYPGGRREDPEWMARVVRHLEGVGTFTRDGETKPLLAWGGHWSHGVRADGRRYDNRDYPHWQWGRCRPTPSQLTLDAYARGGKAAVWALVGAA